MRSDGILMETVNDWASKRRDVARDYAASLVYGKREDWRTINLAIIERWSESGLEWIKREAWKLAAVHPHAHNTDSIPKEDV